MTTLMPFHKAIMASEQWANAETCRDLIEDKEWLKSLAQPKPEKPADDEAEQVEKTYTVEVSGKRFDVKVRGEAMPFAAPANGAGVGGMNSGRAAPKRGERKSGGSASGDDVESPLQGNMWKVLVKEGDTVEEGQLLCIIEAMKMENEITAHKAGKITKLAVKEGEPVASGALIASIAAE